MLHGIISGLVNLIAPPSCIGCGEPEFSGAALCSECTQRLHMLRGPACTRCAYPSAVKTIGCRHCEGFDRGQDSVTATVAYEGDARAVVAAFKSRRSFEVAKFMADLIARSLPDRLDVDAVVPVPESAKRKHRYGFNQADLLAAALGREMDIPLRRILRRERSGRQVGLAREARFDNVRDAFSTQCGENLPKKVLLVDDVITTCATVASCAAVLKGSGVKKVHCAAFARTLNR